MFQASPLTILSSVKLDENMAFVSVDGKRRVSNVKVWNKESGKYEPIDLNKKYTLASHSYLLMEYGGGATMFKDSKIINNTGMLDVELLEMYITENLGGVVGEEYAASQNRINVIDEHTLHTVTFVADGKALTTVQVKHGADVAAMPEIPVKVGFDKTAPVWDNDGKNITEDTIITAVYTENTLESAPSPNTGDNLDSILLIPWIIVSLGSLAAVVAHRKTRENN